MAGSRRWPAPAGVVAALLLLVTVAGCARPVGVDPAPSASDPVCAELLQSLPEVVGGADRRSTTSQASRAWGDPAIVLRCGVDPLPPTTQGCVAVAVDGGAEVDWVVAEDEERSTFTTYGRLPAVEVSVPAQYAGDQTILVDLSAAVGELPRDGDRECL